MGDVDELNSLLGVAGGLDRIQNELFDLGADLSVPYAGNEDRLRITQDAVDRLEQEIDEANSSLPELKSFVLPGGSERAAQLFLARAVCRRAERAVLAVPDTNPACGHLSQPPFGPPFRSRPRRECRSRRRRSALASGRVWLRRLMGMRTTMHIGGRSSAQEGDRPRSIGRVTFCGAV